jgi:hypothetical protein
LTTHASAFRLNSHDAASTFLNFGTQQNDLLFALLHLLLGISQLVGE